MQGHPGADRPAVGGAYSAGNLMGSRGVREALGELTKSARGVMVSEGQRALRRRIHALSMAGRRMLKHTNEQVVWQDGCFSVSAEAKWDETRCGRDVVLSNGSTTVTRSNGNEWGGVLGAQLFVHGTHSFTFVINKCQTDYVYVGIAYDNVDLNDNYNGRNIVLRAGDGSLRVLSSSQGCYGGYRTGDVIRIEVDMTEKVVVFYKNDQRLCHASGLAGPVRPFVSIGSRDVVITMKSQDPKSLLEDPVVTPPSPMMDIALRTGLQLVFSLLLKEDNARIRMQMLNTAFTALRSLAPLSFFREASGIKDDALTSTAEFLSEILSQKNGEADEERKMAALVLLELAVARGSLSFTLSVMMHLEEGSLFLDASALPTLRRIGSIEMVTDLKVRSLFFEGPSVPESPSLQPPQDRRSGETERPHWTTPANPTDTSQSESHPSGMQPQRQSHRDQQTPPQLGQQVPIASRPRSPSPASHGFASSDGVRGEKLDDAFRVANQTSSARGMMDALMIGGEAETVLEREGGGAMLHSVVVLAQLERAASRLKTGHTFLAPCAVDARPTTMRQLYALIVRYSPAEPASHADGTRWGRYILTALLRLLALNFRQLQRLPSPDTLEGALLGQLRSALLNLVGFSHDDSSASNANGHTSDVPDDSEAAIGLCRVQEEAVAALRAGTPVLFNDPAELVGLLDVMLPKQCANKASATEEHFLVMLLSYLAKPPVVWRVLQLATSTAPPATASGAAPAFTRPSSACMARGASSTGVAGSCPDKEPGAAQRPACTRLVECLLDCVLHHLQATVDLGSAGSVAEAQIIPSACIEVLVVAWRMQLAHWASMQANSAEAEQSLKVCSDMASAVLQHAEAVVKVGEDLITASGSAAFSAADGLLEVSLVAKLLPEVLAGVSILPPDARLVSTMTSILASLDTLVECRAAVPSSESADVSKESHAVACLKTQPEIAAEVVDSPHPCGTESGVWRRVVCIPDAAFLLVELDDLCATAGCDEWVDIFDSHSHFVAGPFSGIPRSQGGCWPEDVVLVSGDTVTILLHSSSRSSGGRASFSPQGTAWGLRASVKGYSGVGLSIECSEVVFQGGEEASETERGVTPLCLPETVVLSQISFDPRASFGAFARLSLTTGSVTRNFAASEVSPSTAAGGNRAEDGAEPLPSSPVITVEPNIRFDFTSLGNTAPSSRLDMSDHDEWDKGSKEGGIIWKGLVCSVLVSRSAKPHWLVEVLRLLACVSAQTVGTMVGGRIAQEKEATCKKWINSELLRMGRASATTAPDLERMPFNLPGRPHALRQNPALDRLENTCVAAMLHHVGLLDSVIAHGGRNWNDSSVAPELSKNLAVLRKIALQAGKVRRVVMQAHDQIIAAVDDAAAVADSAAAGAPDASYETLCAPYLARARLLLDFVPALLHRPTARYAAESSTLSPYSSPGKVEDRSFDAPVTPESTATSSSPSPSKRWQMAVLKVIGNASSPSPSKVAKDTVIANSDKVSHSGWEAILPLLQVHRANWRMAKFISSRMDSVVEQTASFLSSEVDTEVMFLLLARRQERAEEIEKGLQYLTEMLRARKGRIGRQEMLHALLNSNWSSRHYLEDIAASSSAAIGRVRALFNGVCHSLVHVLVDPSSSCELRDFSATALAMVLDSSDLTYLSILGLPRILAEFVASHGASLHLSVAKQHSLGGGNTGARRLPVPLGNIWYGLQEVDGKQWEMAIRLSRHEEGLKGAGHNSHGAFTIEKGCATVSESRKLEFEAHHSGNLRTVFRAEVSGRTMKGKWSGGGKSGAMVLYRTHRIPVPRSWFGRVNNAFIRFDGRAVAFTGTNQIGVVQADQPLTKENPYFEVQVLDKGSDCAIAVGVAHRDYPLDQMPGWRQGSIAYHMDDGKLFFQRGQGQRFGDKCGQGDVVGCGIELTEDGDRITSVYWTKNGELAGREICANALSLPLYASLALHSEGERVYVFEAPPPACLASSTVGQVNAAGEPVRLGTERGFTHLYYCGQRHTASSRPGGTDATCGPAGGAQCAACESLQDSLASRQDWDTTNFTGDEEKGTADSLIAPREARGSPSSDADAKMVFARDSVWRLLRVLLLQASDQEGVVHGNYAQSLWMTLLAAIQQQAAQVERVQPETARNHGRIAVVGKRCIEDLKVSSGQESSGVLLTDETSDGDGWTSVGEGPDHWLQLNLRPEVSLHRLSVFIDRADGQVCPAEVKVYAGDSDALLRPVHELQVDTHVSDGGPMEIVALEGADETFNVVRVWLKGVGGGQVRVRRVHAAGFVFSNSGAVLGPSAEECGIIKRVEVSTNKVAKKFLTDGRQDTCWQSDGRSGQHWIRLHVEPDAIITTLAILVNANDGNYCPSLVDVFVGDSSSNLKKLRTCQLAPSGSQKCTLLDKCSVSYRFVQINIRENNGGCDCKVRGVILNGRISPNKCSSANDDNAAQILQELLATAHAATKGRTLGLKAADSKAWITHLARLIQLPEFNEVTRIKAASLMHQLCRAWGAELSSSDMQDVTHALGDTIAHTSEACAVMRPLSTRHLCPLRDLHAALVDIAGALLAIPAWEQYMVPIIRCSFTHLLHLLAPQSNSAPARRFDFVEVWWSGSQDAMPLKQGANAVDRDLSRPSSHSQARITLFSACAPEPHRMLLNVTGRRGDGRGDAPARSYHIESFEASPSAIQGAAIWLRVLHSGSRRDAPALERHLLSDLVDFASRSGAAVLVQSLDILSQVMKGEAGVQSPGQFSGVSLPTNTPWFVRVGCLTPDGPRLESTEWVLLCRSAVSPIVAPSSGGFGTFTPLQPSPSPRALPSPASVALPGVELVGNLSARASAEVNRSIFKDLLSALLAASSHPVECARPLGLRVIHSRLARAVYQLLQVPECLEVLVDPEEGKASRSLLLELGSHSVRAPLHLSISQLLSKSNFLCQRLGPDLDTVLAGTLIPETLLDRRAGAVGESASEVRRVLSTPSGDEDDVHSSRSVVSPIGGTPPPVEAQLEDVFDDEDVADGEDSDSEEREVDDMVSTLFGDSSASGTAEELLLIEKSPKQQPKTLASAQQWQRKLGRLRSGQLIAEAAATEDAIAIYFARLSLLTVLNSSAMSPAAPPPMELDVETLATLLRRLFRTIRPDLSAAAWSPDLHQRLQGVLESQMRRRRVLAADGNAVSRAADKNSETESTFCSETVAHMTRHACLLLRSLAAQAKVSPGAPPLARISSIALESKHNYSPNTRIAVMVRLPTAASIRCSMDSRSTTKRDRDKLQICHGTPLLSRVVACFHGQAGSGWAATNVIRGSTFILQFETDGSPGEWGFRLVVEPLDAEGQPMTVPLCAVESLPSYPRGTRGKLDVTLCGDFPDTGDASLLLSFSQDVPPEVPPGSPSPGRLKLSASGQTHVFQEGFRWKPVELRGTSRFTLDWKTPAASAGAQGRMEFNLKAEIIQPSVTPEGSETEAGPVGRAPSGETLLPVGPSDGDFVAWVLVALCAPTTGLLARCGEPMEWTQTLILEVTEASLEAVTSVRPALRTALLRALATSVRGSGSAVVQLLSKRSLRALRVLREAAVSQYATELPLVGSQRVHFSTALQCLVEVVAALDSGPVKDIVGMSRAELVRAIEAVDGAPATALCRAVLQGNAEQVQWCLCRGARAWTACPERLVQAFPLPHSALHYAAWSARDDLIQLLFDRGGDLHAQDGDGNHPLAWAVSRGHKATVEKLLALGAHALHQNRKGVDALQMTRAALAQSASGASAGAVEGVEPLRKANARAILAVLERHLAELPPLATPGLVLAVEAGLGIPDRSGPQTLANIHPHPIQLTLRANEWRCDGCTVQGQGLRYRSNGPQCDFDLCQACWDAACRFRWLDARDAMVAAAATSAVQQDEGSFRTSIEAVASHAYNPLPESWRHDQWLSSRAFRTNDKGGCSFDYLHLDGTALLRTAAPVKCHTIFLVLRVSSPAVNSRQNSSDAQCLVDVGLTRLPPWELSSSHTSALAHPSPSPAPAQTSGASAAGSAAAARGSGTPSVRSGGEIPSERGNMAGGLPAPAIRVRAAAAMALGSAAREVGEAAPLRDRARLASERANPPGTPAAVSAAASPPATVASEGEHPERRGSVASMASTQARRFGGTVLDDPGLDRSSPGRAGGGAPGHGREVVEGGSGAPRAPARSEALRPDAARRDPSGGDTVSRTAREREESGALSRDELRSFASLSSFSNTRALAAGRFGAGAGAGAAAEDASRRVPSVEPPDRVGGNSVAGTAGAAARQGMSRVVDKANLVSARQVERAAGAAWEKVYVLGANDSTPRLVRGGGSDEAGVVAPEDRSEAGSESVAACEEEFLDGTWQVVVLQAAEDKVPVEHLHLFGTRRGSNKCKGDLAAVLVYDHALDDTAVTRIALHLKAKYRIEPLDAEQRWADRIPRNLLMRRMETICQQEPPWSRLDIPKWLDRYIKCFQVVDSITAARPLPSWFKAEIEPHPTGTGDPSTPTLQSQTAGKAVKGEEMRADFAGGQAMVEALFDAARCGAAATLDASRTNVEFSGMASVLMTSPIPSEGVHVMEFEVLGRDQCLVGVAAPDVDVETYLGNKRGGYGFFAAEGTLKVDGDWKGGHGLAKFKRGDRVGVHVDMSRRTLHFSISRWVPKPDASAGAGASDAAAAGSSSSQNGAGAWRCTVLERVVEGLPSLLHFAVGGAAGGELSIAGGSTSASSGEERVAAADAIVDGGYDNPNWPEELDTHLVAFLNEKASERRKHPRNIRSSALVGDTANDISMASLEMPLSPLLATSEESAPVVLPFSTATSASDAEDQEAGAAEPRVGDAHVVRAGAQWDAGSALRDSPGESIGGGRSVAAMRARFVVLKKLESLVAATLPLVDLAPWHTPDSAVGRLVAIKARLFEATKSHLWDAAIRLTQERKEDIPSVTLYRGAAMQHRRRGATDWRHTVFGQLFLELEDSPLLRSRSKGKGAMAWQVSFAGEGGDDYGGLFRESVRELAGDLQSDATPLFIPVPNSRHMVGFNRDTFLPNPACLSPLHLRQYAFIGKLMGSGMRTANPVGLDLPPFVWRRFLGEAVGLRDLSGVDERFVEAGEALRGAASEQEWDELRHSSLPTIIGCAAPGAAALMPTSPTAQVGGDAVALPSLSADDVLGSDTGMVWTVRSASGRVVPVGKGGASRPLVWSDRHRFVAAAIDARLHECDRAVAAMRRGLASNVPTLMLPLFTPTELMVRVSGEVTVDLEVLKGIIKNKLDGGPNDPIIGWLWATLEAFSNEERKQFLGFVWGRERLPRDTSGLQLEVRTQGSHGDEHLPSSHTCFNALDIPRYSSLQVLSDKLRYAIQHCKAIDADFSARGSIGDELLDTNTARGEWDDDVASLTPRDEGEPGATAAVAVGDMELSLDENLDGCRVS